MSEAHTVLVVDDDEDIRDLLAEILRDLGHVVHTAGDGSEALRILDELSAPPSLMLLDLMMPRVSGLDVLAELARADRLAQVPVVVMSAAADRYDLLGVRAAYKKPISIDVVLSVARQFCS